MNLFTDSIIQPRIRSFFSESVKRQHLAHAYLFYGREGCGKEAFALELAKALTCLDEDTKPCNQCSHCLRINHLNHPDVQYIFPISKQTKAEEITANIKSKAANPYRDFDIKGHKNIPIEKIRELKNEAKYAPFEAPKRFFIITAADYLSREAANSFLKLLEEPPESLIIILITHDLNALPDTIRSRCQLVHFPPLTAEQIEAIVKRYHAVDDDLQPIIRIAQNNVKSVFELLETDARENRTRVYQFLQFIAGNDMLALTEQIDLLTLKKDKNSIIHFLQLLLMWLRDVLHYSILHKHDDFINLDFIGPIEKFADYFKNADFQRMIILVEEAARAIEQNAHPALTLTNLAFNLSDVLLTSRQALREAL